MNDALTTDQAAELAKRIINTMRPTPPLEDWVEELTGLSHQRAWHIFRTLRAATEDGLRIGTFLRLYRDDLDYERRAQAAEQPATPAPATVCLGCLGVLNDQHRPTGDGCTHCRIPGFAAGRRLAESLRIHGTPVDAA